MLSTRPESLIKIENSLRSLKDAEKKAAGFISSNAQSALAMTISDVTQESGVSEATVSRLCCGLEFPGFRAFKLDLARQGLGERLPRIPLSLPSPRLDGARCGRDVSPGLPGPGRGSSRRGV